MGNHVSLTTGDDTGCRFKVCRGIGQGNNLASVIRLIQVNHGQFSIGYTGVQGTYTLGKFPVKEQVADFFLAIAGVNWSIISGVCEKKLVIILRNDGLRKGAGNTAKEAFCKYGSAGGHKTMARAELDVRLIRKDIKKVNHKALTQWIIDRITLTAGKKIE